MREEAEADDAVDVADKFAVGLQEFMRPPVDGSVGRMVVLNGLKEAVSIVPAASCGGTAVVFAFDVDRRVAPKLLRRFGVEIGAGRIIDENAVVTETKFVFRHFRHQEVVFLFKIGADDELLSAFIHDV